MTRPIVFLFLSAWAAASGACVAEDGGAVEANWVIRTGDGRAINDCDCADPEVRRVRFTLVGESPEAIKGTRPCDGAKGCEFACQRHAATTAFDVPVGRYAISLTPLGAAGQDLTASPDGGAGVQVPAGILRDVVFGQVSQLSAILIVANCAAACGGANETAVCKHP